ncbi:O-antigen translocase [Sphingomonas arvum]
MGGASAVNVVIGLVRTKVAALILGPAGVGLVGLLHNLIQTAATLAGFGIGNVATRQVAEAGDEPAAQAAARTAMLVAAVVLGLIGAVLLVLCREPVAAAVLGDRKWANAVAWLSLGAAALVGTAALNGILMGVRAVGALARASILSALLGTAGGIAVLLMWGTGGILPYVLLSPLAALLVSAWFVRKSPSAGPRPPLSVMVPQWSMLARLGLAFTVGSLAGTASQLAVRSLLQRQLGAEDLGQYQAAVGISLNYIGFILAAMATDYYPRLTVAMRDSREAVSTINHQAEVALLLAGPLLVGTVALAPLALHLLYSGRFLAAADLLRWQICGDFLKIASWPLGFVLLAGGWGKMFVAVESAAGLVLVGVTAVLLPRLGVEAAGVAYVAMYTVYFGLVWLLARRLVGFAFARGFQGVLAGVGGALATTLALLHWSERVGAIVGVALAGALAVLAVRVLQNALPAAVLRLLSRVPGLLRRGRPAP